MTTLSSYSCASIVFLSLCVLFQVSNGLQCKKDQFIDLLSPQNCPSPFSASDEEYCCENNDGTLYCCDFDDFAKSKGAQFVIPVAIGIIIGILAGCFLCCLCCPCCMLYKRRHQGTVYGRVQQPAPLVNQVPQGANAALPMPMPPPSAGFVQQPPVMQYAPHPAPSVDYSSQSQVPPPPYSAAVANEAYAKQSAYNPNYYGN